MVWAGISWRAKTLLVFVDGNMYSIAYVSMLDPFIEENYPTGLVFQQDGAPCHTSKFTREYFMEEEIVELAWVARSPDMNPIENIWGILARAVYREGRQFDTLDDLREALQYE